MVSGRRRCGTALISLAGGNSRQVERLRGVPGGARAVTLLGYSDQVRRPQVITVPAGNPKRGLAQIRSAASGLDVEGNTATYTALREAYRLADRQVRNNPDALTSIVLMTDGEQNEGISETQFRRFYIEQRTAVRAVPTFTVKFGPADADELSRIARLTGGKLFEVEDTRLVTAFRQIRADR